VGYLYLSSCLSACSFSQTIWQIRIKFDHRKLTDGICTELDIHCRIVLSYKENFSGFIDSTAMLLPNQNCLTSCLYPVSKLVGVGLNLSHVYFPAPCRFGNCFDMCDACSQNSKGNVVLLTVKELMELYALPVICFFSFMGLLHQFMISYLCLFSHFLTYDIWQKWNLWRKWQAVLI